MSEFVLLGHDCPYGAYPAPVIPVGKVNGSLVAVYPAGSNGPGIESVKKGSRYVRYNHKLRKRLLEFNPQLHRLFAYSDTDVEFYPISGESEFLQDFLSKSEFERSNLPLRHMLAKQVSELAGRKQSSMR